MILTHGILPDLENTYKKMPQNRITAEYQVSEKPSPFEEFSITPAFNIRRYYSTNGSWVGPDCHI
jgi:hypothetical protein